MSDAAFTAETDDTAVGCCDEQASVRLMRDVTGRSHTVRHTSREEHRQSVSHCVTAAYMRSVGIQTAFSTDL